MGATCETLGLPERVKPSDGGEAPEPQRRAEGSELLGELRRELARGHQRESRDAVWVLPEALQDGQRERGRLAAPRLGDAEHVLSCQCARDAPALHCRRAPHAQGAARVDQPLRQAEVRERGGRRQGVIGLAGLCHYCGSWIRFTVAGLGVVAIGLASLGRDGRSRLSFAVFGLRGGSWGVRDLDFRQGPDLGLGFRLRLAPLGEDAERLCLAGDLHAEVQRQTQQ
jgi:hypothetical protein